MRLNTLQLGAGDAVELDYDLRVDIREGLPGVNLVGDAAQLTVIADDSIALCKASHIVEHFDEAKQAAVLAEWRRVLVPRGLLLIWTPDLQWLEDARKSGEIDEATFQYTYNGARDHPYNYHYCLWNRVIAAHMLAKAGFLVRSIETVKGSLEIVAEKQ